MLAGQFGYNCDGIGLFALDETRQLLCVNHEFPMPALMFPGWVEAREARALGAFVREHAAAVPYMQAAVGLSVVELARGAQWSYVRGSQFNRRITTHTAMEIAGPARTHALLNPRREAAPLAYGTLGNCAAGTTPWRTYVTAEENVDDYFGNGAAAKLDAATELAHRRSVAPARQRAPLGIRRSAFRHGRESHGAAEVRLDRRARSVQPYVPARKSARRSAASSTRARRRCLRTIVAQSCTWVTINSSVLLQVREPQKAEKF